jgi:hypothetical protein
MSLLLHAGIPALLVAIGIGLFCITNANHYVPTVSITASSDGGKTYSYNLKSLPWGKDIYLKYEVSIKAMGFWRLLRNTVYFDIDCSGEFKPYDYAEVVEKKNKKPNRYSVVASSSPKKTEIILKLSSNSSGYYEDEDKRRLTLSFDFPFKKINYTVTLDFASPGVATKRSRKHLPANKSV